MFRMRVPEQAAFQHHNNRPGIAPETPEQNTLKQGEGDEPALNPLKIFAEPPLHTGVIVGSSRTALTSNERQRNEPCYSKRRAKRTTTLLVVTPFRSVVEILPQLCADRTAPVAERGLKTFLSCGGC
jgi:hypothetical protein